MKTIRRTAVKNLVVDLMYGDRTDSDFKYIIDRRIRRMHSNEEFPMTPLLESTLKEYNLYDKDTFNQNTMRKYNRELKSRGFCDVKDAIQVEHMRSVKTMTKELMDIELTDDLEYNTEVVIDYLIKYTYCIYKLKYDEKDLQPEF